MKNKKELKSNQNYPTESLETYKSETEILQTLFRNKVYFKKLLIP